MAPSPDSEADSVREVAALTPPRRFPCAQCGAQLVFQPGTAALVCEYCGHSNPVDAAAEPIDELDYRAYLARLAEASPLAETRTCKCTACGAEFEPPAGRTAFPCPFCDTEIVATGASRRLIKPKSLLPFRIERKVARESFRKWLHRLWFAPNALKRFATIETRLNGMYIPYWTYDADTASSYTGQRGDDYWDTESYTTTENGRTVHRTRQVRKTRWTWVSGRVRSAFDDVLVVASRSLPEKYVRNLEPWDLSELAPYADDFLSGFQAECYQLDLAEGFKTAREIMDETIRAAIRHDIGGDHQRISSVQTQFGDITFKHILLPIWISAYRYRRRVYRFLVNGRTGEVQGERPYSWAKITLFILAILAAAGGVGLAVHLANS